MDDLKKYLSEARIRTFENINSQNPLQPYLRNIALCEAFYPAMHFLEIILRNKISKTLSKIIGSDWLETDLPSIFDNLELENIKKAKQNLNKINKPIRSDNIISELNFGFWISLFHKKYEAKIWQKKGALQAVFSNHKNTGLILNVKRIRSDLENIKKLRNRISHHEPIINLTPDIKYLHDLIYFYLKSLAPDLSESIAKVDRFESVFNN